jgi:DNA-binding beta-propeller fold protein YncE
LIVALRGNLAGAAAMGAWGGFKRHRVEVGRVLLALAAAAGLGLGVWAPTASAQLQYVSQFGQPQVISDGAGKLFGPQGFAVNPSTGDLYVADTGNSRVEEFDSSGTYVRQFGAPGFGPGQFAPSSNIGGPFDVAIDTSNGDVYASDTLDCRVEIFNSTGLFLREFGSPGTAPGQFSGAGLGHCNAPYGLAVDPSNGDVYTADPGKNQVQKFDSNGTFILAFGTFGNGPGQFDAVTRLAVDPSSGDVYVNSGTGYVNKFDSSGTFLGVAVNVPIPGVGVPDQVTGSYDFALDPVSGAPQYVPDARGNVIKLDSTGAFVSQLSLPGGAIDAGVTLDRSTGDVYVLTQDSQIDKFDSSGNLLSQVGSSGSPQINYTLFDPLYVAVDPFGGAHRHDVYVTDLSQSGVHAFDPSGNLLFSFSDPAAVGAWGISIGFMNPFDTASGTATGVFVTDPAHNQAHLFDEVGNLQFSFGLGYPYPQDTVPPSHPFRLTGVALSLHYGFGVFSGCTIACGSTGQTVALGTSSFDHTDVFTDGVVNVSGQDSVAWNPAAEIPGANQSLQQDAYFVTDPVADVVTRRGYFNDFLSGPGSVSSFGAPGSGDGQFNDPRGVAVDSHGNIFVVDSGNNRVEEFDQNGNYLSQIGGVGNGPGQFVNPIGIAIDPFTNDVYVVDAGNQRVQRFAELDTIPPTTRIALTPSAPDGQNGFYLSAVHVIVSAMDNNGGSGVSQTRCVLDPASAPSSFDDLPSSCPYLGFGANVTTSGSHALYAASVDKAGNKEAVKSVSFKIDRRISASGNPVTATEGANFTGSVASISDPDSASPGDYSAMIDWGDGTTPSSGTLTGSGGSLTVGGSHTYADEGSYQMKVSITDGDGSANNATTTPTATVGDAALTASGQSIVTGQSFKGAVATFTDANTGGGAGDFSATIDWGDGSTPANATITSTAGGGFAVGGSHTYSSSTSTTVKVAIMDDGGAQATASSPLLAYGLSTGGNFVIGDGNATIGTQVTFWGARWATLNRLSAGSAPPAFKGFETTPITAACNATWGAASGNSAGASPTIPQYMLVIVASKITEGTTSPIAGDTAHLVVVKTNSGYTPDPSTPGTGTVVANVC